jgi:hypothetical protein
MFVIYTAGTVDALRHFVPPLLSHTPWTFRLVANGCTGVELETLADVAGTSPRLSVQDLGTDTILPHGEALSVLLADRVPGVDHVGFLDSDILVTADVADGFTRAIQTHDAVFSAPPIWLEPTQSILDDDRTEVSGPYRRTADGLVLGSSYLAIYRQDALRSVMAEYAVTPGKYTDTTALTPTYQRFLAHHGLTGKVFESTKLLNLAFTVAGRPVTFHDPDSVLHIGGYSLTAFRHALTDPAASAAAHRRHQDVLDYRDERPYMPLKRAVTERLSAFYTQLVHDQPLTPQHQFPDELERRVRLVEAHWQRCLRTEAGLPA